MQGFRNFISQEVELSPETNLIFGANGSGKSNLLEAIHYICTAKSFRHASDESIKNWDAEFFRLEADGYLDDTTTKIEISWKPGEKKRLKIQGVKHTKLANLYEHFKVVSFSPDDVELVYGSPSVRRQFLDISISQLRPGYISVLWELKKVLAQRNALLRELGEAFDSVGASPDEDLLDAWDDKLAGLAVLIHDARKEFVQDVSRRAMEYHSKLSGVTCDFHIEYKASPDLKDYSVEQFRGKLQSRRSRELLLRQSLYGPHRDDLQFMVSEAECRNFASRGQVKTVVLAIKLAVFDRIHELCGEAPILLLDEMYSDLDRTRLDSITALLGGLSQVVVTTSKLEEIKDLSYFRNSISIDTGLISKYTP